MLHNAGIKLYNYHIKPIAEFYLPDYRYLLEYHFQ